ncbi:Uu.00g115250.m01.CDS01 [Anthostomella pinea]|uniref:Uu.00g115250.m01.CDS01 n=1 Tax=Anthostomella pinea TaxID=933095 RepID=A0AAI8VGB8_9PEZI|nr:Uu.00g115250.m01.CDS01 [Anthostomella pinea]
MVAAASAMLVAATPLALEERKMETSVVMVYNTVTVTGGAAPALPTMMLGEKAPPQVTQETVMTETAPAVQSPAVVIVTVTPEQAQAEPTTAEQAAATTEVAAQEATVASSPTTAEEAQAAPTEPASDDMQTAAIYHHNLHRSNHSAPEMAWSGKFAGYASNTAATCKFAHDMDQGDKGYGQNIAMWAVSSGAADLGEAGAIKMATTDMWYNGEFAEYLPQYYGQATPDMSGFEKWGHLSQLLWKESTDLGCSAQFCAKGSMYDDMDAWFMVCNYGPPGNVGGGYGTNVLKPLGKSVVTS